MKTDLIKKLNNLNIENIEIFFKEYSKDEIKNILDTLNVKYRTKENLVSDNIYDLIYDMFIELYPDEYKIGYNLDDNDKRKEKLPVIMPSMNKVKTLQNLKKWLNQKNIKLSELLVISPKLDGLSMLEDNKITFKSWTRGDKNTGRLSTKHIILIDCDIEKKDFMTYGEIIICKEKFKKYQKEEIKKGNKKPSNARNTVSGFINDDNPTSKISIADFIRYGIVSDKPLDKIEQLKLCNEINKVKLPYKTFTFNQLNEELLNDLYNEWNNNYDIDGLVIEINDAEIRENLGSETNDNPAYARAYKANFETSKCTTLKSIKRNVNKFGKISYVGIINTVYIDGVEINNVTLNNASYIDNYKLFVGEEIEIIRSGEVIPKIIGINNHKIPFRYMFDKQSNYNKTKKELINIRTSECNKELNMICPSCQSNLKWNDTHIDLICINDNCEQKQLSKIISFFDILEVAELGEPTIKLFFEKGYKTIKDILSLDKDDLLKFDKFAERKSEIIYNNIHNSLKNVNLEKLQHASSCFKKLGSKQLKLINDFLNTGGNINDLISIKGIGKELSEDYVNNINNFNNFKKDIEKFLILEEKSVNNNDFNKFTVVFTKIRDKELENIIISGGGRVTTSVSKNTTHLIIKEKNAGKISSKEKKALDLGIEIYTIDEFKTKFLK